MRYTKQRSCYKNMRSLLLHHTFHVWCMCTHSPLKNSCSLAWGISNKVVVSVENPATQGQFCSNSLADAAPVTESNSAALNAVTADVKCVN